MPALMPHCDACGAHVSTDYYRVRKGPDGDLHGCPSCTNPATRQQRTNESVKDCGLGRTHARGRVHARVQVFLALCLRLVVAITNYERGDNPGSTISTV